jgi:hypothetical protein
MAALLGLVVLTLISACLGDLPPSKEIRASLIWWGQGKSELNMREFALQA